MRGRAGRPARRRGAPARRPVLAFGGERHRLDLADLTGGRAITVYGQNEIVRDLIAARRAAGGRILFDAELVALANLDTERPCLHVRTADADETFVCDFIAGCDGFHGISRASIPQSALRVYGTSIRTWLGILAQAAPASPELVYCLHDEGFALFSMRSTGVTRLYLQCAPDERLDAWPDERIWRELQARLQMHDGWVPNEGPILQKGLTGMRSFVVEPMRRPAVPRRRCRAIVPPTGEGPEPGRRRRGARTRALDGHYRTGSDALLDVHPAPGCAGRGARSGSRAG